MMMVKKRCAVALLVAMMATVHGFSTTTPTTTTNVRRQGSRLSAASDADTLTEYMVKAHEEKLRAVKDAEDKKNAEIQALKSEIEQLKSSSSSSALVAPSAATADSKEELAAKVIAYQNFIAKYIVEAQEQKVKAVKAAEDAVKQKYEDKLLLLGGAAAPPVLATAAATTQEPKLYKDRNAQVGAAAAVGKSRWGDKEVERVAKGGPGVAPVNVGAAALQSAASTTTTAPAVNGAAATAAPVNGVPIPPEVEAADHGLRSDGSVGGLTLAERVALGATTTTSGSTAAAAPLAMPSPKTILYQGRNKMVAAAGKASRWGEMEVQKAIQLASDAAAAAISGGASSSSNGVDVQAADHGLRSDGSVGGPSLAERVNLGAQLLGQ